ncbi:hypothetical protein VMCG_01144 [Cytospora schulzeri]|uniref:Uncharacterized protein n=1 Tax=Cytospora schulzeri TaxID=448051 RepID=A0A423X6S0_9PEZI|nr:hypothetical protein VMCG_01144 [Valsa malicola]
MAGREVRRAPGYGVHASFKKVSGKTMRCDFCNARNTTFLNECSDCQLHICNPCAYRGKLSNAPNHYLALDAESDDDARNLNGGGPSLAGPRPHVEAQPERMAQQGPLVVSSQPPSTSMDRHTPALPSGSNSPMGGQQPIPVLSLGRDYDARSPSTVLEEDDGANRDTGYSRYQHGSPVVEAHPNQVANEVAYGVHPNHQYGAYAQRGAPGQQHEAHAPEDELSQQYGGSYAYGGAIGHHGIPQQHAGQVFGQRSQFLYQSAQDAPDPNTHPGFNGNQLGPYHAGAPTHYGYAPQHGNVNQGFQQTAHMPPQRAPAAIDFNLNPGARTQDYTDAFDPEQYGQHPYIGHPQVPFQHNRAAPAGNPALGLGVGASHGVVHDFGQPIVIRSVAEEAAAILEAHRTHMAGFAADRHARETYHAQMSVARDQSMQRFEGHPPHDDPPPAYEPQPPQLVFQHADPAAHLGAPPEEFAPRRRRPYEIDAVAVAQDEDPRSPRTPERAANRNRASRRAERHLRAPIKSRSRAIRSAAARHRQRHGADDLEDEIVVNTTGMFPPQEDDTGVPDAHDQTSTATGSADGRPIDRAQPSHPHPRPSPALQAASSGRSYKYHGKRNKCRKGAHIQSTISDDEEWNEEEQQPTAPANNTTPVPGSEEVQEALATNPILGRVRDQEGEVAALEMAGVANLMVAMERDRSHVQGPDGRRGLDGRELPEIRANELEIERRRENMAPRRRDHDQHERKRQKR